MKIIGLLGGMSWESSIEYERIINQEFRRRLGGSHSAQLIVISYDFADIEGLQSEDRWTEAGQTLARSAHYLEQGGAEVIVLCTNTMHLVADAIEQAVSGTFVHIADATASAVKVAGISTVGLISTRFTMEMAFYRDRLQQRHGLRVLIPTIEERQVIHDIIYAELIRGVIKPASRHAYLKIIDRLRAQGAQGVISGCTEIEPLVGADDVDGMPWFPTAHLHALAAVDAAFGGSDDDQLGLTDR